MLFDLGPYPVLVSGRGGVGDSVRGEMYRILAPDPLLTRVDQIKNHRLGLPDTGQYRRLRLTARLDDGRTVAVWAYAYNRSTVSTVRIVDGDYRNRHGSEVFRGVVVSPVKAV